MDYFVTVKLYSLSICLAVTASYPQVSHLRELPLDWDMGKPCLQWCKEVGAGSVSAKVVLREPD